MDFTKRVNFKSHRKWLKFKHPEDYSYIKCDEDALKIVERLNATDVEIILNFSKYGLNLENDIRLEWLYRACSSQRKFAMRDRLTSTPFEVEVRKLAISDSNEFLEENYISGTNTKICGARLKALDEIWRCSKKAGWGTSHPGYGRCMLHELELSVSDKKLFWAKLKKSGKARSFDDFLEAAESIKDIEHTIDSDIDHLILMRQMAIRRIALYLNVPEEAAEEEISKNQGLVPSKDIDLILRISEKLANIKKTKHFIQSRGMIPVTQIPAMFIQLLNTLLENEDPLIVERITNRAMSLQESTIFPVLDEQPNAIPAYNSSRMLGQFKRGIEDEDFTSALPDKARIKNSVYSDAYTPGK